MMNDMGKILRFLTCLLLAVALLLGSARRAEASAIQLEITITFSPGGPAGNIGSFGFGFFENPAYVWPGFPGGPAALVPYITNLPMAPGATSVFYVAGNANLSQLYFTLVGSYYLGQGNTGAFVAEPPGGVDPSDVYQYGAPGVLLAGLLSGNSLSGELFNFLGANRGSNFEGTWEIRSVPEPSSVILVVTGFAAVAARRRFMKRRRPELVQ